MLVFISGASSGIGEACAREFAAAGYDLLLVARRTDRLNSLREQLSSKHGVAVHTFGLDVRNRTELDRLMQEHSTLFSKIDVLVNNAGLAKGLNTFQEGNPEDWDTVIDTNIKGLLYVTRAILPHMISRSKGHIVNLGSVAGHWVYEKGSIYCASKFAVRALTEGLRFDLNGTGIRVTEIAPGMVETEFSEVRYGDKERGRAVYRGKKPLSAKDIAETILWCVQRPEHVNIQSVIIYPTEQASVPSPAR